MDLIVPPTDLLDENRLPKERLIKITKNNSYKNAFKNLSRGELEEFPDISPKRFEGLDKFIFNLKNGYRFFWEDLKDQNKKYFLTPNEFNAQLVDFIDGDIIIFEHRYDDYYELYFWPFYVYEKNNKLYIYPMELGGDNPDDPFILAELPLGTILRFGNLYDLYPSVYVDDIKRG